MSVWKDCGTSHQKSVSNAPGESRSVNSDCRKVSNIKRNQISKFKCFIVSSCSCLYSIRWSHVLSWEWRCSWSSAERRCSNYIWVINNLVAYKSASYIRNLTVVSVNTLGPEKNGRNFAEYFEIYFPDFRIKFLWNAFRRIWLTGTGNVLSPNRRQAIA